MALITLTSKGLFCSQAGLYIDPVRAVSGALITHAHADHARAGNGLYIAHENCVPVLNTRLGKIRTQGYAYGDTFNANGVRISFHPAGHVPGSAQIRFEYKGEVWVISGDYKLEDDGLSSAFEPVKCHTFITESTFGLPVFRWKPQQEIFQEIHAWWVSNTTKGKVSVMMAYGLGKAQRILMSLDSTYGPVVVHPALEEMNAVIRAFSPSLPLTLQPKDDIEVSQFRNAFIIVPPAAIDTPWLNRFKPYSLAFASGWMNLRGRKMWNAADMGFVLSDHADWDGLNEAVAATGAEKIYVTHGYAEVFAKWLREKGKDAEILESLYEAE